MGMTQSKRSAREIITRYRTIPSSSSRYGILYGTAYYTVDGTLRSKPFYTVLSVTLRRDEFLVISDAQRKTTCNPKPTPTT